MSRIKIDGLEICDLSAGYWSEIILGGPDDLATYRGEDDVVPEASGMDPGLWVAESRILRIQTLIVGDGATGTLAAQSYRSRADALAAKMDPASTISVVVYAPLFGLSSGQTATLAGCRPQNITGAPAMGDQGRLVVLELKSIASPPNWVIA